MKPNNSIKINCTTEDKEKIQAQATRLGYTLQEYILKICLNTEVLIQIKSR